ncbi:MAG: hypothetical protein OXJ63_03625, partial [Gammaproteobacteria bacterium]|nr:hypothetical protein [Gammaproteobacteria bacterium]
AVRRVVAGPRPQHALPVAFLHDTLRAGLLVVARPQYPQGRQCQADQKWNGPDPHQRPHGVVFSDKEAKGSDPQAHRDQDNATTQILVLLGLGLVFWAADCLKELRRQFLALFDRYSDRFLHFASPAIPEVRNEPNYPAGQQKGHCDRKNRNHQG